MAAFSMPSLTDAYVRIAALAVGPKRFRIFIFLSPSMFIPPDPAPPPFSKCSLILLASTLFSSSPSCFPKAFATRSCSCLIASESETPSRYSMARTLGVHMSSTTLGILTNEGSTPYFCMSRVHSLKFSASFVKSSSFSWRFLRLFATSKFSGANNLVAISRFDRSASNSSATSGYCTFNTIGIASSPSCLGRSVALWTCATLAAPIGVSSKLSKRSCIVRPVESSTMAEISSYERGGTPSWRGRRASTYCCGRRPCPMVLITWPILT
mmetsp:Transcript_22242/g.47833  ORF Transcript_22242/g.47833 Transcript_22242/m.47833 type:complete len:268 (-) Transcript_22242:586-1389(-)